MIPFDNEDSDIPQGIYELKKKIEDVLFNLNDIVSAFSSILIETDPIKILSTLEEIELEYDGSISLGNDIYHSNFHYAVLRHKRIHEDLENEGVLEQFLELQTSLGQFICSDLAPSMKLDINFSYVVKVKYDKDHLNDFTFSSAIVPTIDIIRNNKDVFGVIKSSPGFIEAYFIPGKLEYGVLENRENSTSSWPEAIRKRLWYISRPIMEKIYHNKFLE